MERLEYDGYGGPEVVHLRSFTLPQPTSNEVVVRVTAASINPMDWKIRSGQMKMFTGSKFPRGLGADFSGIVEAVGSNVSAFKPGDAVLGTVSMKRSGAFAPMLITTQDLIVKKPANVSFAAAASLPVAGVTAWEVLVKKAGLKRGQTVFINGAMGAVGQAAVSIARGIGAQITGRVSPQSIAQAQALGVDTALDYTKTLPSSLNGAYDVVFDCNGSLSPQEAKRLLKPGGIVFDITPTGPKILSSIISRSYQIVSANVKAENLQPVVDLVESGKLVIPIARTISLADASAQLAALERGERLNGKVVIAF